MPYDAFGNYIPEKKTNGNLAPVAQLPTMDSNKPNQMVSLTPQATQPPPVAPTPQATEQANTGVLAKAQTNVLGQDGATPLQQATQQSALGFVQNPMGDFQPEAYKQGRMEKSDTDWANSFEGMRRQYGNVSGSGLLQENMLQNQLAHNVESQALESNIDQENYDRYIKGLTESISSGQAVGQQQEDIFSQRLGNLGMVRGMAEGERGQITGQDFQAGESALDRSFKLDYLSQDQAGQQALTELKGKIDTGQMLQQQDFAGAQSALDRAHALAIQNNDVEGRKQIEVLRGEIDAQAQTAQNEFAKTERIATQSWTLGRDLTQNEYAQASQILDQKNALAMQSNDINAQKEIAKDRMELELAMQTNGMNHDESMRYLDSEIAAAMADGDVVRQKEILGYQTLQNLQLMKTENGYDVTMASFQKDLQIELDNNNNINAMAMMEAQNEFVAKEAIEDRLLEQAKIALSERQVDMAEVENEFQRRYAINPDNAIEYVNSLVAEGGMKIEPKAEDAVYEEIEREMRLQEYQFALTHREDAEWGAEGEFLGLSDNAAKAFNAHLNSTIYGAAGLPTGGSPMSGIHHQDNMLQDANGPVSPQKLAIMMCGADIAGNQNNDYYNQLLNEAPPFNPRISDTTSNKMAIGEGMGADIVVRVGGRLMVITEGKHFVGKGRNREEFSIMDLSTGVEKTFSAESKADNSLNTLGAWGTSLADI